MIWTDSIFSDGTTNFVSDQTPAFGSAVTVFVRFLADAPVRSVMVCCLQNGAEGYIEAKQEKAEHGLVYYSAQLLMKDLRLGYFFILLTDEDMYFYTQNGVTTYIPDHAFDFVLLSEYRQPGWVEGAVFYQIFPERFANGNPDNDVLDGEYEYEGAKTIRMKFWDDAPLTYEEGHLVDFYGGDLEGIRQKLDYLQELGVTVLYLNPIFTAYSNHKYDCIDYYHVDRHFGGDEALAALCREVHERGMHIILDISINHTGHRHRWVRDGKPFYFKNPDGSLQGWWGLSTLPMLDYRNEELCDLIYRGENAVLRKWMRPPYSIDGWRFDVADVFARNGRVQLADKVWKEVCNAVREENPEAFIIGEHWGDCADYLQGDLWNAPMNYFGFGRIIRQFAGLPDLALAHCDKLKHAPYRMSACDVVGRAKEHYSRIPQVIADCQMNLFDSHDVPRFHAFSQSSFEKWKSAVIAQLLWTGIPCIYYGDEVAIGGGDRNDIDARSPMPWDHVTAEGQRFMGIIQVMTQLRRTKKAFSKGSRQVIYADGAVLAVARFYGEEVYVGVLSMEEQETTVCLPLGILGKQKPAGETDCFGERLQGYDREEGDYALTVPAFASFLFGCD